MKDIAVFIGQVAKFECIVQGDPSEVYWAKNSEVISNNNRYNIEFRNGVCRLTIQQAYPGNDNKKNTQNQKHLINFFSR